MRGLRQIPYLDLTKPLPLQTSSRVNFHRKESLYDSLPYDFTLKLGGLYPSDDCLRKWADSETGLVDRNAAFEEAAAAAGLIPNAIHKSSMGKHGQQQQPHEKVLNTKERWRCRRKHPSISKKRRLEANWKWKCEMRLISNAAQRQRDGECARNS